MNVRNLMIISYQQKIFGIKLQNYLYCELKTQKIIKQEFKLLQDNFIEINNQFYAKLFPAFFKLSKEAKIEDYLNLLKTIAFSKFPITNSEQIYLKLLESQPNFSKQEKYNEKIKEKAEKVFDSLKKSSLNTNLLLFFNQQNSGIFKDRFLKIFLENCQQS